MLLSPGTAERHVPERKRFSVTQGGERLDRYLVGALSEQSRSRVQQLIRDKRVHVNSRGAKPGLVLAAGDHVSVDLPEPAPTGLAPERLPVPVLYEDEDLLVVDKPAGMPVHPAPGHREHTLVNALLGRGSALAETGGLERPGIVHRLDKDTSGLMVVAKTPQAHQALSQQLQERSVTKRYLAVVSGRLEPLEGAIDAPVGRDPGRRERMTIRPHGRASYTRYRVLRHLDGFTLVEVAPETGRTHQIRVHFAAIGHPVLGDPLYGRPSALVGRQFLHASRLGFRHPRTLEHMEFESPLPDDLNEALAKLEREPAAGKERNR